MKRIMILTMLQLVFLLGYGQIQQGFKYQAEVRNAEGTPLAEQPLNLRITLESTGGGTVHFTEVHDLTTNQFGLISIVIGEGTVTYGTLSDIPWENGNITLKAEIKLAGAADFSTLGQSVLYPVPYALYAASGAVTPGTLGQTLNHDGTTWVANSNIYNANANVGIGTVTPTEKLEVMGNIKANGKLIGDIIEINQATPFEEPIFVVRNSLGKIVFAVYESGVRMYVDDTGKGNRGGFAVGGFSDQIKDEGTEYFRVTPDSVRINIRSQQQGKGNRGGFAVGGYSDQIKLQPQDLLFIAPDSARIYLNTPNKKGNRGGFAVGGYSDQIKAEEQKYLFVGRDSTRVYIEDSPYKGNRGGFAVGGYSDQIKGGGSSFFNISPDASGILVSQPRILWYPLKNAFLAGQVKIDDPADVGENSMSMGFETKAKGNQSQAMGYKTIANGDYSTAIGKNAVAHADNSFAFGNNAVASSTGSYAFGENVLASNTNSYAFGYGSQAAAQNAYAFGNIAKANGTGSFAFGDNVTAGSGSATYSFAFGKSSVASGGSSYAFGDAVTASNSYSYAFGKSSQATAQNSYAFGNTAKAYGSASFAFGDNVTAGSGTAANSFAFGKSSAATGASSYALGDGVTASNSNSYAFGKGSQATAQNSYAFGNIAKANGTGSFAFGDNVIAGNSTNTNAYAFGNASQATGKDSYAFGRQAKAQAFNSFAFGNIATASAQDAYAFGSSSNATGAASYAFGAGAAASYAGAYAFGTNAKAQQTSAMSFGNACEANATYSTAIGYLSKALKSNDIAIGIESQANGINSVAIGTNTYTSGKYATALGYYTTAQSYNSTVIGRFNVISGSTTTWSSSDPLFVIGNGSSTSARSNAFTVLKNGNVGINVSTPTYALDVNGIVKIVDGYQANGKVLGSDAYGVAKWVNLAITSTSGTLTVNRGGTGRTTLTAGKILVGNGTSAILYPTDLHWDNTNSRLGIGTTSPAEKLHVLENARDKGYAARVAHTGDSYSYNGLTIQAGAYSSNTNNTYMIRFANGANTVKGNIALKSDRIYYNETSDKRLKTNITQTSLPGIKAIKQMPVVDFAFKSSPSDYHIGFLAQDIEKVLPEAVSIDENGYLQLSMSTLIPVLTKAIQEQQQLIEELQEKNKELESLKAEIEAIKAIIGK